MSLSAYIEKRKVRYRDRRTRLSDSATAAFPMVIDTMPGMTLSAPASLIITEVFLVDEDPFAVDLKEHYYVHNDTRWRHHR